MSINASGLTSLFNSGGTVPTTNVFGSTYSSPLSTAGGNWWDGLFGGGGIMGGLNGLMSAGGSLLGAFNGMQQMNMAKQSLNLAKQQFSFQKGLANRNLANQSQMINTAYDSAANIAAQLGGNTAGVSSTERDATIAAHKNKSASTTHVDGSAIS